MVSATWIVRRCRYLAGSPSEPDPCRTRTPTPAQPAPGRSIERFHLRTRSVGQHQEDRLKTRVNILWIVQDVLADSHDHGPMACHQGFERLFVSPLGIGEEGRAIVRRSARHMSPPRKAFRDARPFLGPLCSTSRIVLSLTRLFFIQSAARTARAIPFFG